MKSKKKLPNDQIDLTNVIIDSWKNKWKIVLIILITVAISVFLKINSKSTHAKVTFLAQTKIVPISTFVENEYSAFNTYLIRFQKNNEMEIDNIDIDNEADTDQKDKLNNNKYTIFNNAYLNYIDKFYLYNLFIEKLAQRDLFKKTIKKLNFVEKKNYPDNKSYENAVTSLASSIKISDIEKNNHMYIEFTTDSKKDWKDFLNLVEQYANNEIQIYLKNNFNLFMTNSEKLKQYAIEDINFEIENNFENKIIVNRLEKIKKKVDRSKNIKRLKNLFENTPIIKSSDFTAARFDIQLTKYIKKRSQYTSMQTTIYISILLGLILGIIFIFVKSTIKKSR